MAVFSSDQVNHVFVKGVDSSDVQYGIDGAALAGTAPTATAIGKSVTFSATAKDKKGNVKFNGGITMDTLSFVGKEKTFEDILMPVVTVEDVTAPTGDQYIEVCATISGALCDDEGNQLTFCGNGATIAEACADLQAQAEARNAKTLVGQLIAVVGTKIAVATPDQDYKLGNWVAPTLQVFTKLIDPTKAINKVVEIKAATPDVTAGKYNPLTDADGNVLNMLVTAGQQAQALEYFALGERADVYRNIGWPKSNPSKQLITDAIAADAAKTFKATTYEGYYAGDCEDVQKSKIMVTVITVA